MPRRGFTLIELMACLIVITVLAAVALPYLQGPRKNTAFLETAHALHDAARYAHLHATLRKQTCRLALSTEPAQVSFGLQVEDADDPAISTALQEGPIKKTTLPQDLRFAAWIIEPTRRDRMPEEEQAVWFYPDGGADAAALQLTDGNRTWTLLIAPHTGRSELIKHAVFQTPNLREDLDE